MYSSDVGKMIGCPVLHVNGDNPEVLYATCGKIFLSEPEGQYLTPGHVVGDLNVRTYSTTVHSQLSFLLLKSCKVDFFLMF